LAALDPENPIGIFDMLGPISPEPEHYLKWFAIPNEPDRQ